MTEFEVKLDDVVAQMASLDPALGEQARKIVAANYLSQLGDSSPSSAAQSTAQKLTDLFNSVSSTLLATTTAYYQTKGKLADLKLASKGSAVTQAVNSGAYVANSVQPNILLWAGLGLAALFLLRS